MHQRLWAVLLLWERPLAVLLLWAPIMAVISGLLFGLYLIHQEMKAERAREAEGDTVSSRKRVKDGLVDVEEEDAERLGLKVASARAVSWTERVSVYGRVVHNPRAASEVRSPFAGTLRAAASAWPAPGTWVHAGQMLGWVDVRVGPEVRLDLENKLAEARIRQRGAEEVVGLQQDRVHSLEKVTSREIISRAELDAALVQLTEARTQAAAAKAAVELWQKALEEVERRTGSKTSPWSQPLTAPADGEVTELAGRPGMAVEAGAVVVGLVDFRRPRVRLDVPPELVSGPVAGAPGLCTVPRQRVELFATPASPPALRGLLRPPQAEESPAPVEAVLAGPAPQRDATSQFVGYWYEVPKLPTWGTDDGPSRNVLWRPGLQVKAYLQAAGAEPQPAVAVPATAVLYHEGRALVYVRLKSDKYQRREVSLLGREGDSWVLTPRRGDALMGVAPDEPVVSSQAQALLSEEFRGEGDND
jgi:biotin carboxyl carrier protein